MVQVSFEDFFKVPDLKFDISRLRKDLEVILEKKNFNSLGISHFGAIPINRIPNDNGSVEGHNVRGKYWTIADETGKVVSMNEARLETKIGLLEDELKKVKSKK